MTKQKVLQGIAEVKTGVPTFACRCPWTTCGNIINPRRHPPVLRPTERDGRPLMNFPLRCYDPTALDIVCDDQVVLTLQYSTQWDSLVACPARCSIADDDGVPEDLSPTMAIVPAIDIVGPARYDFKGNDTLIR